MVQPQTLHRNVQISDITQQFRDAAYRLRPGKLVKDEDFTLFEAVGALEIGDPKMDSGSLGFDPDLEQDLDLPTITTAEEVIWLMDELMCREVAWHMGYPLSQTLFTSVHIERLLWPVPRQLVDARFDRDSPVGTHSPSLIVDVLQPYCIGLIKCCDLVLSMITSELYYEEEDFATQIYNRPLLHDFSVDEVLVMLRSALIWLQDSNLPTSLNNALKARLELREFLLGLFRSCAAGERSALAHLERSVTNIMLVESSANLGRAPTDEAFTLKIQRKLASSVPPRPMVAIERPKAFDFLRQLSNDTTMAFQVFDITASGDLLVAYQTFMAQSPQPAVYVRAVLQSFLTCKGAVLGKFAVKGFMAQDIQYLVKPTLPLLNHGGASDDTVTDAQLQFHSQLDSFMSRCGHSFLNLFPLEWDQIQAEAEDVDAFAQSVFHEKPLSYPPGENQTYSYSLSSWVYHHKLMQLRTVVQMGFELSVYAPHEFAGMYWYLSFLSSTHLSHLERISFFVSSKQSSASTSQDTVRETLRNLYRHFTWLKATEALAKALHRVFVVIQRQGQLTNPSPTYASELLRYELRMRPFMHLAVPEPIDVDVAEELSSLRGLSDTVILQQASQLIHVARKSWDEVLKEKWSLKPLPRTEEVKSLAGTGLQADWTVEGEWTKDVRNAMRACIGAGIAISTLSKALHEGRITTMRVEVPPVNHRDRWHSSWPVPKILY